MTATDTLRISTDQAELDLALIHEFLSTGSSWAQGISFGLVRKSVAHSLCFGGFVGSEQVAFARVISDYATFANLVDVFVLPAWRGRGFGKQIVRAVMNHAELQGLRRFTLATFDAHELYAPHGFAPPQRPQTLMEIYQPDIYATALRR